MNREFFRNLRKDKEGKSLCKIFDTTSERNRLIKRIIDKNYSQENTYTDLICKTFLHFEDDLQDPLTETEIYLMMLTCGMEIGHKRTHSQVVFELLNHINRQLAQQGIRIELKGLGL